MKPTKQILTIQKKLSPIAQQAEYIEITDSKTMRMATALLSLLNDHNDKIREEKEKVTKPLLQALKAERSRWKSVETMHEVAIGRIRLKMSQYQTEIVNTRKAEEQAIANRIAPGKGHITLETASKKMDSLQTIEKEVATDEGLVQFRETKVLKVIDSSLIPHHYFDLNEVRLLKDLKDGVPVEGAELETIQTPVNYR